MNLQLQKLRKLAGFKTQIAAAEALGVPERRYASWERGEAMINLEQAYNCALLFGCSIDAIAGLENPVSYIDPKQKALNGYYESMNTGGRNALVETARLMSDGDSVRIEKDRPQLDAVPPQVEGVA